MTVLRRIALPALIGLSALLAAAVFAQIILARAEAPSVPPRPAPIPAKIVPIAPPTAPGQATAPDRAPRIGGITIGAFAPEALPGTDISIPALDSDPAYANYRQAVRARYGADLADMNYLGVGVPGWQGRYQAFQDWLIRAGAYGDPTLALEPLGKTGYSVFTDGPEMAALRAVFQEANTRGITVWVRFASESNLRYSVYSVYNDPVKIAAYRRAEHWFRGYMPKNVRLVFSPLINTVYLQSPSQMRTILAMYEPGAYDRIGGTLYATSWLSPRVAYDWYYKFMRRLDPATPFQICELGGIYPRSSEVKAFLIRVARGDWPGVQRVNLFAGDLNSLAVSEHGHFGFILPGASSSYLSDLLGGAQATFTRMASDKEIDRWEALSAGKQSPEMTLEGTIARRVDESGAALMKVDFVTDEMGERTALVPTHRKRVIALDNCVGGENLQRAARGDPIKAIGWDSGDGTPLRAREVIVGE